MLRIIAGDWRGRKLAAPAGQDTRPTADRTRETLFNMLASRLGSFEGLSVADLFAGSGALGMEALSRGAAHCLFVEQDDQALRTIADNIAAFGCRERTTVHKTSVMQLAPAKNETDLILLDPPYNSGAGEVALDRMLRLGWIGSGTWIALETEARETPEISGLQIVADRKVGKARLHLMRLAPITIPAKTD